MGGVCSSDQSAPQKRRPLPCNMHRMNPQRNCMSCQQFMRSQNFRNTYPDPRAQRYPPRLQQRYPPQFNRQRTPERPPVMRPPMRQSMRQPLPQRGRGMMNNQGPPKERRQYYDGPSQTMGGRPPQVNQGPPEERRQYYDGPSQTMGGRPPQVGPGSYSQIMGGRSPQMEAIPQQGLPQIRMPPPQEIISQPQMLPPSQIRMAPTMKTMPFQAAAPQPPVIYEPSAQNVEQVVTLQPITQGTCTMNVTAPQPKNVAFQQEVLPIPKVINAPEPPPCPTDILVPDAYSSPQQSNNGNFVQQPQARYQPRYM